MQFEDTLARVCEELTELKVQRRAREADMRAELDVMKQREAVLTREAVRCALGRRTARYEAATRALIEAAEHLRAQRATESRGRRPNQESRHVGRETQMERSRSVAAQVCTDVVPHMKAPTWAAAWRTCDNNASVSGRARFASCSRL